MYAATSYEKITKKKKKGDIIRETADHKYLVIPTLPQTVSQKKAYLLNVVFRQCFGRNIDSILLHFLFHIGIFDDGLSLITHD